MHNMAGKPTSTDVYELLMELKVETAVQHEKIDQILTQAKKTNGRVTDLEEVTGKQKIWTIQAIAIAMLLTSWLWIKESRDFVFKFLGLIV